VIKPTGAACRSTATSDALVQVALRKRNVEPERVEQTVSKNRARAGI